MTLWLSQPCHFIPARLEEPERGVADGTLAAVFAAYGREPLPEPPAAWVPTAHEPIENIVARLAVAAAGHAGGPRKVQALFDCRTGTPGAGPAPSYVLADLAALGHAVPIGLGGMGGAEVPAALHILSLQEPLTGPIVICASQRMSWPDSRRRATGIILADAAAAVAVGPTRDSVNAEFRLIRVALASGDGDRSLELAESTLRASGLGRGDVRWVLYGPAGAERSGLSDWVALELRRSEWPEVDFGSADLLVSLSSLWREGGTPPGLGLIVYRGWFGAWGIVLLEAMT